MRALLRIIAFLIALIVALLLVRRIAPGTLPDVLGRRRAAYTIPDTVGIVSVLEGVWGVSGTEHSCATDPRTLRFSRNEDQLFLGSFRGESVMRFLPQVASRSWLRVADPAEATETDADGLPVRWELVLTSHDSYRWRRRDWAPWRYAYEAERCAPGLAASRRNAKVDSLAALGPPRWPDADPADAELNGAIAHARATLPALLARLAASTPQPGARIRVRGRWRDHERLEDLWMANVSHDGHVLHGTIDDVPRRVNPFMSGTRQTLDPAAIIDWIASDDARICGGFTVRVERRRKTKTERFIYDQDNGLAEPVSDTALCIVRKRRP
jgi:uncharacterized protein YegJ (DUF2314 family)